MRTTSVLLFILAISITSGCAQTAIDEAELEAQKAAEDEIVLGLVLNDFLHRKIRLFDELRPDQNMLILNTATAEAWRLSADWINGELRDTGSAVSEDMIADLGKRNAEPVSLEDDHYEESIVLSNQHKDKHRNAKAFVTLWMPGYNKTLSRSIVRFAFDPGPEVRLSPLDATATYLLAKRNGKWVIEVQTQSFYLFHPAERRTTK